MTDPLWVRSGAQDVSEYALWADHLCGCACLQMVLGGIGREVPPIHAIRRGVQAEGGYIETPEGIRGLIYAGAVAWLAGQGIASRIRLDLTARDVAAMGGLFIASVHPGIRFPDTTPDSRGGHLVLVFGTAEDGALRLHNPSGDRRATQEDARIAPADFDRFFAGRGLQLG